MKRMILTIGLITIVSMSGFAQKFAMVDMEYIFKNIPTYETANEQLTIISRRWQQEVETLMQEVQTLYKNYQTELVFLSNEMKVQREEEIITKEKEAHDLKRHYFGPEGELFKKRQSLMKPIQDEIYNAIQEISRERDLSLVFDRSSAMSVIFTSPKLDISDAVLQKLGFSK